MSQIIYQNPETNHIAIVMPCIDDLNHIIETVLPKDSQQKPLPYLIVSSDAVPKRYMSSWELVDGKLIQSRDKLWEIKKNEWRQKREVFFKTLDVDYMKALETGDTEQLKNITAQKQALRDVTLTDVSLLSLEQLEVFVPDVLK